MTSIVGRKVTVLTIGTMKNACLIFKNLKTTFSGDDTFRGNDGPLKVTRGRRDNPLTDAWIDAAQQAGFAESADFNGAEQEGPGLFDRTIYNGVRQSTATAYLGPALHRDNLNVIPNVQVTKIVTDKNQAVGVEYLIDGELRRVSAEQEVILCGGAINSPQLLMLSGIGAADSLSAYGITPLVNLPGVGQNLQDHLEVYVQYACKEPVSLYPATRWFVKPFIAAQWYVSQSGVCASNHFDAGAFLKSSDSVPYPDLQFHFLPIAMDYDGKDQYRGTWLPGACWTNETDQPGECEPGFSGSCRQSSYTVQLLRY